MTDIGMAFKCNNNCIMCTEIMPSRSKEPSAQDIFRTVASLKNQDYIVLTGGEPTLRKDIFYILNYINRKCPKAQIKLITNGRMLSYDSFVSKLKKIKNLLVITEIHGDEELHDKITRAKGSFSQAEKGIHNLIKNKIPLEMRIVIHKMNYKAVPWIAEHISRINGIKRVVMFPIDIIGNAYKNRKALVVDYKTIMPFVEDGIEILRKNKVNVNLYHFPLCILKPKYRETAKERTVEERRVTFMEGCNQCIHKKECSRIWKTYAVNCGTDEFKAIKNEK